jgi:hypothetical protein
MKETQQRVRQLAKKVKGKVKRPALLCGLL